MTALVLIRLSVWDWPLPSPPESWSLTRAGGRQLSQPSSQAGEGEEGPSGTRKKPEASPGAAAPQPVHRRDSASPETLGDGCSAEGGKGLEQELLMHYQGRLGLETNCWDWILLGLKKIFPFHLHSW